MARTPTGIESFLSLSNRYDSGFAPVKLHVISKILAEVVHKTNVRTFDQLGGVDLSRWFGLRNVTHQHDTIFEFLGSSHYQVGMVQSLHDRVLGLGIFMHITSKVASDPFCGGDRRFGNFLSDWPKKSWKVYISRRVNRRFLCTV